MSILRKTWRKYILALNFSGILKMCTLFKLCTYSPTISIPRRSWFPYHINSLPVSFHRLMLKCLVSRRQSGNRDGRRMEIVGEKKWSANLYCNNCFYTKSIIEESKSSWNAHGRRIEIHPHYFYISKLYCIISFQKL